MPRMLPSLRLAVLIVVALGLVGAVACAAEEPAQPAAPQQPAAAAAAAVAQETLTEMVDTTPQQPALPARAAPAAAAIQPDAPKAAAGGAAAAGAAPLRAPVIMEKMAADLGYTPFTAPAVGPAEYPTKIYTGPRPTTFTENPRIAAMVKAGTQCADPTLYQDYTPPAKCASLMERLPVPEDILIYPPVQEIGVYGGTKKWVSFRGANLYHGANNYTLFINDYDTISQVPFVAKSVEMSADGREFITTLRRGAKWSDGKPLTMEDFVWVWEDINYNKEKNPKGFATKDVVTGNEVQFSVVDEWRFKLAFDTPNFTFLEGKFSGNPDIRSRAWYGHKPHGSQFLPKYAKSPEEFQAKLDAFGVDNWPALLRKCCFGRIAYVPWIGPFVKPHNGELWNTGTDYTSTTYEKGVANPYFFGVDPHGQQLPYLDGFEAQVLSGREATLFRVLNGESDGPNTKGMSIQFLPVFHQNMVKGDFSITTRRSLSGNDATFTVQQDFQGDDEWARLLRTKDFRIAMSLAMDRVAINEIQYLGLGVPMNPVPHPQTPYYPGPEWTTLDAVPRDLPRANQLMEKMGYTKNADGIYNRLDGTGELGFAWYNSGAVSALTAKGWREFGVNVTTGASRPPGVTAPEAAHMSNPTDDSYGHSPWWVYWFAWWPIYGGLGVLPCAGSYYFTGGEEGCTPSGPDPAYTDIYGTQAPAGTYPMDISGNLKKFQDLIKEGHAVSFFDPRRAEIGREIYKTSVLEKYHYGTVGFSAKGLGPYRNNLRNIARCCDGGTYGDTTMQYFEDGIDNLHHPGNRSKKYKSWSFALN